jgi:pimeloyl-ACP methyl ester carboxylesterase
VRSRSTGRRAKVCDGLVPLVCFLTLVLGGAAGAEETTAAGEATWLEQLRLSAEALHWSDELVRHDWRLQRRPGTEECRLLDPQDRVVCLGDGDACRHTLATLEAAGRIEPVAGPTVIVLHGLGESRRSMKPLVEHLRASLDATILTFGYASTKAAIADHGRALAGVVTGLPAGTRLSFVGHSLGNLVVRSWLGQADTTHLDRLDRVVMLGPPNQGSELARMASRVWVLSALSQGAARDLVVDWDSVAGTLPAPPCPFGIVAGGTGDGDGYSSLLDGDDDAVVTVAETLLDGADDFFLVPVRHAGMMKSPTVQDAVTAFLATGRFPVPRTDAGAAP